MYCMLTTSRIYWLCSLVSHVNVKKCGRFNDSIYLWLHLVGKLALQNPHYSLRLDEGIHHVGALILLLASCFTWLFFENR